MSNVSATLINRQFIRYAGYCFRQPITDLMTPKKAERFNKFQSGGEVSLIIDLDVQYGRLPIEKEPVILMFFDVEGDWNVMACDMFQDQILGTIPSYQAEDIMSWLRAGGSVCGRMLTKSVSVINYRCKDVLEYKLEWEGYVEWI